MYSLKIRKTRWAWSLVAVLFCFSSPSWADKKSQAHRAHAQNGNAEQTEQLTQQQRKELEKRRKDFDSLSPQEQARVREARKKFNEMSPEKRRELKEKWNNMTQEERRQQQNKKPRKAQPG